MKKTLKGQKRKSEPAKQTSAHEASELVCFRQPAGECDPLFEVLAILGFRSFNLTLTDAEEKQITVVGNLSPSNGTTATCTAKDLPGFEQIVEVMRELRVPETRVRATRYRFTDADIGNA